MTRKKNRTTELQISSISHIHDPLSARKWMELYVTLLKKQLISEHVNQSPGEE
ncbi:hypothetical protein J45TS6_16630 [Paenibacillus sp. J45TS6]|uniref:hypothetical protein n=1 Tax=Paenibacillus sp. J45TS6 TaxID=2807196 RepID=UPI001B0ED315|nr:hypothetical protein [Paenibacillus sp. J45TS6]GIP43204.1 hypothetical protein J45TS6_16630 [Paenibacillus sp. J45TS6]